MRVHSLLHIQTIRPYAAVLLNPCPTYIRLGLFRVESKKFLHERNLSSSDYNSDHNEQPIRYDTSEASTEPDSSEKRSGSIDVIKFIELQKSDETIELERQKFETTSSDHYKDDMQMEDMERIWSESIRFSESKELVKTTSEILSSEMITEAQEDLYGEIRQIGGHEAQYSSQTLTPFINKVKA